MTARTALVAASITVTESEAEFATYTRDPSGLKTMLMGLLPTGIVAVTVFEAVSMTDTVFDAEFDTYATTCARPGVGTSHAGTNIRHARWARTQALAVRMRPPDTNDG